MPTADLELRIAAVETQHASYIAVLSNHTNTLATLVGQVSALQTSVSAIQLSLGTVVADIAALRQRFDSLDAFLRAKLNGKDPAPQ